MNVYFGKKGILLIFCALMLCLLYSKSASAGTWVNITPPPQPPNTSGVGVIWAEEDISDAGKLYAINQFGRGYIWNGTSWTEMPSLGKEIVGEIIQDQNKIYVLSYTTSDGQYWSQISAYNKSTGKCDMLYNDIKYISSMAVLNGTVWVAECDYSAGYYFRKFKTNPGTGYTWTDLDIVVPSGLSSYPVAYNMEFDNNGNLFVAWKHGVMTRKGDIYIYNNTGWKNTFYTTTGNYYGVGLKKSLDYIWMLHDSKAHYWSGTQWIACTFSGGIFDRESNDFYSTYLGVELIKGTVDGDVINIGAWINQPTVIQSVAIGNRSGKIYCISGTAAAYYKKSVEEILLEKYIEKIKEIQTSNIPVIRVVTSSLNTPGEVFEEQIYGEISGTYGVENDAENDWVKAEVEDVIDPNNSTVIKKYTKLTGKFYSAGNKQVIMGGKLLLFKVMDPPQLTEIATIRFY